MPTATTDPIAVEKVQDAADSILRAVSVAMLIPDAAVRYDTIQAISVDTGNLLADLWCLRAIRLSSDVAWDAMTAAEQVAFNDAQPPLRFSPEDLLDATKL